MTEKIIDLSNGFYNIRGNFRIGGVVNIGTQCSLIELAKDRFIFLDSYTLTGDIREQVMAMTDNGKNVEAVLNVHPFHSLHCEQMAKDFPQATFYGSERHKQKCYQVTWAVENVESKAVAEQYPELQFSLPDGIYYIHPNEKIHVGSLLVFHPVSGSLHVDDTFSTIPHFDTLEHLAEKIDKHLPKILLNPLTKKALKPEPNAGKDFCNWADTLATTWRDTRHVCAAHADTVAFEAGEFETVLKQEVAKLRDKLI